MPTNAFKLSTSRDIIIILVFKFNSPLVNSASIRRVVQSIEIVLINSKLLRTLLLPPSPLEDDHCQDDEQDQQDEGGGAGESKRDTVSFIDCVWTNRLAADKSELLCCVVASPSSPGSDG